MTRIHHPPSRASQWTLIGGVLAALVTAGAMLWWSHAQQNKVTKRTGPREIPVPSDFDVREMLSAEQYNVTRKNDTETAFRNAYWDNHRPGIYVDIITNEPLFSSTDKFDSGIGWPSFSKPIGPDHIVEKIDTSHGMTRTEVRAKKSDSHLGHLFKDGPAPTGLRYQVNSAALRFIPAEKLEEEGYDEFLPLFEQPKAGG
jgi:methionine-R-sulfoxide reductase